MTEQESVSPAEAAGGKLGFLAHEPGDSVAVAVRDVEPGTAEMAVLTSPQRSQVRVNEPIPLGHKLALTDLSEGQAVIEYGETIGAASRAISTGDLVHVHNIRSTRWQAQH
ncbi:MAG: UxaA family hydrolase [Acidimicrobiales bacterium]